MPKKYDYSVKKIFNSIFEVDAAWCNELWLLKSILITLQSQTLTGEIHILYSILFEKPFWFLLTQIRKIQISSQLFWFWTLVRVWDTCWYSSFVKIFFFGNRLNFNWGCCVLLYKNKTLIQMKGEINQWKKFMVYDQYFML